MKKNDAVFVDFFGKKAATSKTLAVLALRHHIPVVFAYMKNLGNDKYAIKTKECYYDDIYNNESFVARCEHYGGKEREKIRER